tara:strand:- start:67 stop:234 length:168 start_codon:yes stop_codon:yes gene_type:complete
LDSTAGFLQILHRGSEGKAEVWAEPVGLAVDGADAKFFKKVDDEIAVSFDLSAGG